jgi:hypothetical protein
MDIFSELQDIGRMLDSASVLSTVRKEVGKVMREGFIVTDGIHQSGGDGYDVIVRCGSEDSKVSRRLRSSMPKFDIVKISDGVLGLKRSRR